MPLPLIARAKRDTIPIEIIKPDYPSWLKKQPGHVKAWLGQVGFKGASGSSAAVPGKDGTLARAVFVPNAAIGPWAWSGLAAALPIGSYRLNDPADLNVNDAALGWALSGYEFTAYRAARRDARTLVWPKGADRALVTAAAEATFLVRDLVSTPAEDMGPSQLAAAARALARQHGAKISVTVGDKLKTANYPSIHIVGRAAADAPRLIDMQWGAAKAPKLTLVGKGVCFDSGGLDLKTAAGMRLMKKDMGGAAHALGLASMIMATKLPVRLRVLIPAVENAVAGNAFRPMDVIKARSGKTVEVGNTDAEGRLILSDCLTEACREKPELLLDFATLTGAARVALGTALPALFTNDNEVAGAFARCGSAVHDPVWRLPLHAPYRPLLESTVADISSTGNSGYAGAITAALFLQEFVAPGIPWAHLDIMAYNVSGAPGRPEGGEAMGMRAAYAMIAERFAKAR